MNHHTHSLKIQNALAYLIILAFAAVNLISVMRNFSLTTDEDKHYLYGERVMAGDPSRFNPSTMPFTALNALPKALSSLLAEGQLHYLLAKYSVARMVTLLFSCLVAYLVFYWSRSLYGLVPALFSLSLYVLDPNIIAHSQLVTTDIYSVGTIAFAFFTLWRFAHKRSAGNGLLCLFALGLSQIAKYTAIVLFPLFFATLLIFDLYQGHISLRTMDGIKKFTLQYLRYGVSAVLITIVVINLGFLFHRTFTSFGDYKLRPGIFQDIQTDLPLLRSIPVPVPYPYFEGLDYMSNYEENASAMSNVYLLGQLSKGEGFSGYYLIASLFKVPIATQVIVILSFLVYFYGRRRSFIENEYFLLISVAFFTVYFNFFFDTQVGIRYYLPVFPFLYIFSGSLFVNWDDFSKAQKLSSLALMVYLFLSVVSYHPYYLSYFNEFVWNRNNAYKYLADSNLDWGQNKNELRKYLEKYPGALYAPNNVRPGRLVVRVNDLVGVSKDPNQYAWLRENFEPIDTIAYSYLVYKISPEEIDQLCATTSYCNK